MLGSEIERLNRVLQTKNDEASDGGRMVEQLRREHQGLLDQIARLEEEKQTAGREVVERMRV